MLTSRHASVMGVHVIAAQNSEKQRHANTKGAAMNRDGFGEIIFIFVFA